MKPVLICQTATGKAEFVIDETNQDNAELLRKVREFAPLFDCVTDKKGNVTDVVKTGEMTVEKPTNTVVELQAENRELRAQVEALTQSTQFLEDCLVEMAEIVYA